MGDLISSIRGEIKDTERNTFKTNKQKKLGLWLHLINAPSRPIDGILRGKNTSEITSGNAMYINSLYNSLGLKKTFFQKMKEISIFEIKSNLEYFIDFKNNKILVSCKKNNINIPYKNIEISASELNIQDSKVSKNTHNFSNDRKGKTAVEDKQSRDKAEATGAKTEEIAFEWLKNKTTQSLREIGINTFDIEKYITTSKQNADMGADFKIDIEGFETEYYEVKSCDTKNISFQVTANQVKKALKHGKNFYFLFVSPKTKEIRFKVGMELLNECEIIPSDFVATLREKEYINFGKVIDFFEW